MTDIQSKANAIKALMNSLIDSSDPEQAAELIRQAEILLTGMKKDLEE